MNSYKAQNGSGSSDNSDEALLYYKKYNVSEYELQYLTNICIKENGSSEKAIKFASSLMANLYAKNGKNYASIADYVKNSGWFSNSKASTYDPNYNVPPSQLVSYVRDVIVNGNSILPPYVSNHDCWDCNKGRTCNGHPGDICSLTINGKKYTGINEIKNKSLYIKDQTLIYTIYGDEGYYFYDFASDYQNADPFGYYIGDYNKYMQLNGA